MYGEELSSPNSKYFLSQLQNNSVRFYSDKEPLTKKLITERVLLVLKLYDKIEATKVRVLVNRVVLVQ